MLPPQHVPHNPCLCSINKIGVSLLQCGQPRKAADVLANGLKEIRQAMVSSSSSDESTAPPGSSSSNYTCSLCHTSTPNESTEIHEAILSHEMSPPIIPISSLPCTTTTSPLRYAHKKKKGWNCDVLDDIASLGEDDSRQGHDEHKLQSNNAKAMSQGFIFSCPLTTPENRSCKNVSFDHWCFMILYNLALSFDVLAWSNNGKTTNNMKDNQLALSFYQLAYRVQQSNNLEISTIYLCGLLNNMARLHLSMEQMDASRQCLSGMITILMYITTQNQVYGGLVRQGGGGGGRESNNIWDEQNAYYMAQFWNSVLTQAGAGTPPATAGAA